MLFPSQYMYNYPLSMQINSIFTFKYWLWWCFSHNNYLLDVFYVLFLQIYSRSLLALDMRGGGPQAFPTRIIVHGTRTSTKQSPPQANQALGPWLICPTRKYLLQGEIFLFVRQYLMGSSAGQRPLGRPFRRNNQAQGAALKEITTTSGAGFSFSRRSFFSSTTI